MSYSNSAMAEDEMKYAVEVFGWLTVIEADNKREALRVAKATASSASLFPSDVNESHVKPATPEQIAWYEGMLGAS